MLRVSDLAGKSEAARRVAMRAGITLHEDTVEHRILRIVDPVFLREIFAAYTDVHAAHRDMSQGACPRPYFLRSVVAHHTDQRWQRRGAHQMFVAKHFARAQRYGAARR